MERKIPVQARSQARVEKILDAADAVFLELGFAAATTNHIAARAETSIGSIYRVFPDKEAILVALAMRYGMQMQAIGAGLPEGGTTEERVGRGIDAFASFMKENPGIKTLIVEANHPVLRPLRQAGDAGMVALIAGSLERSGVEGLPVPVMAGVLNTVLGALQVLAVEQDDCWRKQVLAEAKIMVVSYLKVRLGEC